MNCWNKSRKVRPHGEKEGRKKEIRQKHEALHIEDIQRLVTEIEMLKAVLYLHCHFA
jgi:hypothetical protein